MLILFRSWLARRQKTRARSPSPRRRAILSLEPLEDRLLLAAPIMVTTGDDNGNNAAPLAGSLRAAIIQANNQAGQDTIRFDIADAPVSIVVSMNPLPPITDSVIIDAATRPGGKGSRIDNVNSFGLSSSCGSVIPVACLTHPPSNESAASSTPWVL